MAKQLDNPMLRVIQATIKELGYNSSRYSNYVRVPKHVKPCPLTLEHRLRAMELIGAFNVVEYRDCFHVHPKKNGNSA